MTKLELRLRQVLAYEPTDVHTVQNARAAILGERIAGAMAYRLPPVNGKRVSGTFANAFALEFNEELEPKVDRRKKA